MKRRVAVIGAGPAGSAAAMSLARFPEVETLVLESATFPRPKACGSGLSPWCLELLDGIGMGAAVRREAHRIGAARIGGARGEVLELRSRFEAAILRRDRFDSMLAHEAARRGATLREGVRVRRIVQENGTPIGLQTSDGDVEADAVIVANGANTTFAPEARPGRRLQTYMAWYEGVEDVIDAVELYFDPIVHPYYGWVFPEGEGLVNIGIVFQPRPGSPNARQRFDEFVSARLRPRMGSAGRVGRPLGHPVATSHRPTALARPGVLVAGEAGGLVDPATAEGIHHALASGWIAGAHLGELARRGAEVAGPALEAYTRRVREEIGPRLRAGGWMLHLARTPVFGWMIRFGTWKPVRSLLTSTLAGA